MTGRYSRAQRHDRRSSLQSGHRHGLRNATLSEAAELLSNSRTDAIIAIASAVRRPTAIGIVTYRELLNALEHGTDLKRVNVAAVLDRNPLVLHEEEDIECSILKRRGRGAQDAPGTGQGGTLYGAISMERLLGCHCAGALEHRRVAIAGSTHKWIRESRGPQMRGNL